MFEIRWHSRAGHGAITAANALCEIIDANTDLVAQSFPDFGAEKKGAPVVVYNRFDDKRILDSHHVQEPDMVLLLDTSLINENELSYEIVLDGLKNEGALVLNTIQKRTKFSDMHKGDVYHLDATTISKEEIGRNIPNVPMLGALLKISGLTTLETFLPPLEEYLSAHLPSKVVEGNLRAMKKGFEWVLKV